MDENYCNLLEKKVDALEKELVELKQEHRSLEKGHTALVCFFIVLLFVLFYLGSKYGIEMYRAFSDFQSFEQSVSQFLSSFSDFSW